MNDNISEIDFTEEVYTALKDYFVAKIECGVTDITVNFLNGQKFKITIEQEWFGKKDRPTSFARGAVYYSSLISD